MKTIVIRHPRTGQTVYVECDEDTHRVLVSKDTGTCIIIPLQQSFGGDIASLLSVRVCVFVCVRNLRNTIEDKLISVESSNLPQILAIRRGNPIDFQGQRSR